MCLQDLLIKNTITNKITRQGLKVYKVVEVRCGLYYPPYLNVTQMHPYSGTMEATQITVRTTQTFKKTNTVINGFLSLNNNVRKEYLSGFHFFKTKAAAQRLCKIRKIFTGRKFKVITAIVKKSWITKVGYEHPWVRMGVRDTSKKEIVIVAKKAIFPTFRGKK